MDAITSKLPSWMEVDLDQVRGNILQVKEKLPRGCKIAAVVKGNAYGHGAIGIAREAVNCGIDVLAVGTVMEGVELRLSGIKTPSIYLLSSHLKEQADDIFQFNLIPSISNIEQAKELSEQAGNMGRRTKINIKVDTGLTRFGFDYMEIPSILTVLKLPNIDIEGIYTHFATAEKGNNEFLQEQLLRFREVLKKVEERGFSIPFRHAAGSSATAFLPESHFNMVRPGLLLLGIYPNDQFKQYIDLKPVMSLKTRVVFIRNIRKDVSVGYDRSYDSKEDTRLAVLSLGFSDGYPRPLSNRGEVLIRHHRFPIVGLISLNNIIVDIGNDSDVQVGDEAVLIGRSGQEEITLQELASKAKTIVDEICMINPRVPRIYIKGGESYIGRATMLWSSPE